MADLQDTLLRFLAAQSQWQPATQPAPADKCPQAMNKRATNNNLFVLVSRIIFIPLSRQKP
jgi:hypothetical protein